jgi:hypothetical protein
MGRSDRCDSTCRTRGFTDSTDTAGVGNLKKETIGRVSEEAEEILTVLEGRKTALFATAEASCISSWDEERSRSAGKAAV